jgi:hypothetical protein
LMLWELLFLVTTTLLLRLLFNFMPFMMVHEFSLSLSLSLSLSPSFSLSTQPLRSLVNHSFFYPLRLWSPVSCSFPLMLYLEDVLSTFV